MKLTFAVDDVSWVDMDDASDERKNQRSHDVRTLIWLRVFFLANNAKFNELQSPSVTNGHMTPSLKSSISHSLHHHHFVYTQQVTNGPRDRERTAWRQREKGHRRQIRVSSFVPWWVFLSFFLVIPTNDYLNIGYTSQWERPNRWQGGRGKWKERNYKS